MGEWSGFIPVISGLAGVITGGLLTFRAQRKQREWALEDLRLEWKRERLEGQIDSILELVGQSLAYVRLMTECIRQGRTDAHPHATLGTDLLAAASVSSITIRDMELAELFFIYASAVREIRDLHEQGKLTEAKMEECLEEAQTAAQKVGERAETLLAAL